MGSLSTYLALSFIVPPLTSPACVIAQICHMDQNLAWRRQVECGIKRPIFSPSKRLMVGAPRPKSKCHDA